MTVINVGRSLDEFMAACARELVYLQAVYDFELRARHLTTVENRIPDLLSRWHLSRRNRECFLKEVEGGIYGGKRKRSSPILHA